MAGPREVQQSATKVFSTLMVVLGVAIVVRTVAAGGSPLSIGLLLGLLFIAAGCGRLYLARRG